jgi:signal transduction histidine kinase
MQVKVESLDVYCGVQPGITPLQPQATRSLDGRLWFANNNVVQTFDPHVWRRNKLPPNVVVEGVAANGVSHSILHDLKLPALVRNLEIDYTALSFVVPQKVHFRYRLDGYDTKWSEPVSRRQVTYTNLPPSDYEFRVIACNNDGVWNEVGASVPFSVAPAWFQTIWFRIACAGALLILMRGLSQFRLQQLRGKFNVRLEERTRIARELHDTLLQSLHGLMFEFQAARNMFHRCPEDALEALDGAIVGTERAITESQVAIEGLRDAHVAENDLAQLLRATGEELLGSRSADHDAPTFGLTVEGERRTLDPVIRDEVYRIAREVLRNAFRHAHARRIEAEVLYDEREFRLRVRDDGKGMDAQVLEKGGRAGHWGLPGVRERAQQIGARMDLWSEAGAGTEVQLTVAAAIAYEKTPARSGFRVFRGTRNHDHQS